MSRYVLSFLTAISLCVPLSLSAAAQSVSQIAGDKIADTAPISTRSVAQAAGAKPHLSFAGKPLSFEPNRGQADAAARFISRGAGLALSLESTGAKFQLQSGDKGKFSTVQVKFADANHSAAISGESLLPGISNYFPTSDSKSWTTNVPTYSRVHYKDIYPGIDVAFYGAGSRLEYDFVIQPNADPNHIRMQLNGADTAKLTGEGDLLLTAGKRDLRFLKPTVYQLASDGKTREVVSAVYRVESQANGEPNVTFALGKYDHHRELVIDPVVALSYSEFLPDYVASVAVDSSGNTYVAGTEYSNGMVVTKFSSTGTVVYNEIVGTGYYLFPLSIVVGSSGQAYVGGFLNPGNDTIPTSTNAYQSSSTESTAGFLAVFSANGATIPYCTYLGGTDTAYTYPYGLAIDSSGDAYLTGYTGSSTFPVTSGVYQNTFPGSTTGFVTKLNPAATTGPASLVYSTYLGVNGSVQNGIAVDSAGDAYVASYSPTGFPVTSGAFQYTGDYENSGGAYVTKLNPTGTSLLYSAYLGYGAADAITVEGQSSPSAYVTGTIYGADFPVTAGAYQTSYAGAFVSKLNSTGTSEVYSTFLGGPSSYTGNSSIFPTSIALPYGCSSSCNTYVAGSTSTTDYPLTYAIESTPARNSDSGFVTEIAAAGTSALFSTYLNGMTSGIYTFVNGSQFGNAPSIAVDSSGDMTVVSDIYGTDDFPISVTTSNPATAFIARIVPSTSPFTEAVPSSINFGNQPVGMVSASNSVVLWNLSSTAATLQPIQVSPSSVFEESDNCSGTVASGGFCTLNFTFTPNASGIRNGTVTVASNAADSPTTISLTGDGTDEAYVQTSPISLTFAAQAIGTTSANQSVIITNYGDQSTSISVYTGTSAFTTLNNCPSQLAAGASCTATVAFAPTSVGLNTDSLTIATNSGPYVYVSLSGAATITGGSAAVTFSAASLQFNPQAVSTSSPTMRVTVTNNGTEPVVFSSVAASGDYSIADDCFGTVPFQILPQATCYIDLVFSPTTTGTRTGALTFADDATGSPQAVSLTGTGLASTMNVEFYPSSAVSFPDTALTSTSAAQTIYLYNTGNAPLTVDRAVASGSFYITSTSCEATTVAGVVSDGTGAGSYCYVNVTFSPTATGAQAGTLTFNDSAPGSPHVVNLTGNGIAATGAITLNPNGLNFGVSAVGVTNTAQYLYIDNPGNTALNVTSYSFTGTNASDYSITTPNCTTPYALAAGAINQCYVYIQFTPGATGTRTATFNVISSAGTQTVSLTGSGVAATQAIGLTPTSMNLGSIVVGQAGANEYVYLRNTGTATATFSADPVISGTNAADFTTLNYCATNSTTLAAGTSCYIYVSFTPSGTGTRSATLKFTDTAGTQTLALTGTGVSATPTYSLSDYLISYNTQVQGTTSPLNSYIYFNNNGSTSVNLGNVSITGSFLLPAGYNSCNGQTITAGGSCSIYVEFAPTTSGYLTGTLTFNNSSGTALSGVPTVPLAGFSATPTYTASIDPTSETFPGNQVVGTTSAYQAITLTNSGNTPLTVGTITGTDFGVASSSAEFSVASANGGYDYCSGQSVAAGATCTVYPTFTPNTTGARTGTVSFPITYGNASTATLTGNLSGTGVAAKDSAVLTPPNGAFLDQVVGIATNYVVTTYLNNSGNQPFTVGTLTNSNATEFSTASSAGGYDSCTGATVQVGSSCQINVVFTPSVASARTSTITFPVTFADHTTTSPSYVVTGTGVASATTVAISPGSIQFPSQIQAVQSGVQYTTITNTGNKTVAIGTDSISTNSAEFEITYDNCTGTNLASKSTCQVGVNFTPSASATGTQTGVLKIGDNATGGPHSVALTGTAIPASQQITVSQTTLAFGSQPAGSTSSTQLVYFTNQSDTNVTINSFTLGGTNAADFQITYNQCGNSYGARGTCYAAVVFIPLAGTSGALTATIVESDSASPGTHTITLTGTSTAAGPAVALSPSILSFPTQNVGSSSAVQNFSVTNTGSANLTITAVATTNTTEFPVSSDGCSGSTLTPGQHCIVGVKFSPSLGGARTGTIKVTDNATGSPQSLAVTGTGYGIPATSFTPTSLTFANTNIGVTTASQSITLKNTGTDTLQISGVSLTGADTGDFAQTNTCTTTLAPAATCVITVTFKPTTAGLRGADITVTDNANNVSGSQQNAVLTGTGVANPTAALSPTTVAFSNTNIGVTSAAQTTTLTNSGTGPLTITSIAIGGTNPGDYTQTNNCGSTLATGTSCTISVTFTPSASGSRTATVTVTDNANTVAGSTQTATLTGTGVAVPTGTVSPTSMTFSGTNIGATATPQIATLTNSGTGPLTIASVAIGGTNSGDYAETNNCGSNLANGSSCTISLTFTPSAAGTRTATVTITDNANNVANSTQSVSLSGVGLTPAVVSLSPTSIAFGMVNVGSTSSYQLVTMTNTGGGALTGVAFSLTGSNATSFSIPPSHQGCSTTLAAGASCSFDVAFTPATGGALSGAVTISDSATGSPQSIALSGTGASVTATVSPSSLTFGTTTVGATAAYQQVTLANTGTGTMSISSFTITGTNASSFSIPSGRQTCKSTLSAGSTCTFQVAFTPASSGSLTASVQIATNATGSPQTVALTGTGATPAAVSLSPTSIAFSAVTVGSTSGYKVVTLTNTGGTALTGIALTVTGTNASSFFLPSNHQNCGATLAAGASCTFDVAFGPTTTGALSASVSIADSASGSPQSVTLTGTGQ